MKKYYVNNGNLYCSSITVQNEDFEEISAEEYLKRLSELSEKRESVVPCDSYDDYENIATDSDFIASLESLGVDFGG